MKKPLLLIAIIICALKLNATPIIPLSAHFITTLNMVEASGKHFNVPVHDHGQARGPFQIHYKYWSDAVEYEPSLKNGHIYNDVNNYDYAVQIVTAYMNRYGKVYIQSNNYEMLARIHNGGPNAPHKLSLTDSYAQKFDKYFSCR